MSCEHCKKVGAQVDNLIARFATFDPSRAILPPALHRLKQLADEARGGDKAPALPVPELTAQLARERGGTTVLIIELRDDANNVVCESHATLNDLTHSRATTLRALLLALESTHGYYLAEYALLATAIQEEFD